MKQWHNPSLLNASTAILIVSVLTIYCLGPSCVINHNGCHLLVWHYNFFVIWTIRNKSETWSQTKLHRQRGSSISEKHLLYFLKVRRQMCPHCDPHRPCKGLSYVLFHMSPLVRGIYGCWRGLLLHVTINQMCTYAQTRAHRYCTCIQLELPTPMAFKTESVLSHCLPNMHKQLYVDPFRVDLSS